MGVVTIPLSEEHLEKLKEKARSLQVTPEELLLASLEDLLSHSDEVFRQAMKHVLQKNKELYRRLAAGS